MSEVHISGKGKLASALITGLQESFGAMPFDPNRPGIPVIHAGSGKERLALFNYCQKYAVPYIEASTGMEAPSEPSFVYIAAPNLSIAALDFLEAAPEFARHFPGGSIQLSESHQATKTSPPKTALLLCEQLGLESFTSIRTPSEQTKRWGLSRSELDAHAIHEVKIDHLGAEITFQLKITGYTPYIEGARQLLSWNLKSLKAGLYTFPELSKSLASSPLA
jgi:hypothetical protein